MRASFSSDDPPTRTVSAGVLQRGAPVRSWRRAERSSAQEEEKQEVERRAISSSAPQQAGLYSAAPRRFNMPLGIKRLVGITALFASLLLCSCGTGGKGDQVFVRFLRRRRGLLSAMFMLKGNPMISNYTKTSLAERVPVNMWQQMGERVDF